MKKCRVMTKSFIIISIILMVGIIAYQYSVNLNINNQPPSNKWGKGKFLGQAYISTTPAIIKEGKNYIITYNDKNKLKILVLDALGHKKKEKSLDIKESCINGIILVKDKENNFYIEYVGNYSKTNSSERIKLDKDFNIIKRENIAGLIAVKQINDNMILRTYGDSVEFMDVKTGNRKSLKVSSAGGLSGVDYNGKYAICYTGQDVQEVTQMCVFYENGKFSDVRNLFNMIVRFGQSKPDTKFAIDDGVMYFFVPKIGGDIVYEIPIDKIIENKDEFKYKFKKVKFPGIALRKINSTNYTDGKAKILVEGSRIFGINRKHDDVMEYSLSNGKCEQEGSLSKSKQLSTFANICGEIGIYCDFQAKADEGFSCPYNLYMTSTNEQYKKENNGLKKIEKNLSIGETVTGVAYSIVSILLVGAAWIFPGLTLMGIFTLLLSRFSDKQRKGIYIGVLVATTTIKALAIYVSVYKNSFMFLPKELTSPMVGMLILVCISVFCYVYSYLFYREFTEDLPVARYLPFLVGDTFLSLLIFSPYIIN
ncbi:hypothetical protein [Clostridium sp. KNHs214]|uniref:hypothetical protein n=1 Tax=Clostridium sp. KNHs214 TaxID=1540257 RepID=UPI00054ED2AE|nr:hypothetical protein [Clostridium sp. KNHs214]